MEESSNEVVELLKKQLLSQRIIMGVLGALLAAFLIFGAILVPKLIVTNQKINESLAAVDETIERVNAEVIPLITELDMDNVNKAVSTMEKAVSEFDVAGMNAAINDLKGAIEAFDINGLNEAIESLNTTIKPLKNIVEFFGGNKG